MTDAHAGASPMGNLDGSMGGGAGIEPIAQLTQTSLGWRKLAGRRSRSKGISRMYQTLPVANATRSSARTPLRQPCPILRPASCPRPRQARLRARLRDSADAFRDSAVSFLFAVCYFRTDAPKQHPAGSASAS